MKNDIKSKTIIKRYKNRNNLHRRETDGGAAYIVNVCVCVYANKNISYATLDSDLP